MSAGCPGAGCDPVCTGRPHEWLLHCAQSHARLVALAVVSLRSWRSCLPAVCEQIKRQASMARALLTVDCAMHAMLLCLLCLLCLLSRYCNPMAWQAYAVAANQLGDDTTGEVASRLPFWRHRHAAHWQLPRRPPALLYSHSSCATCSVPTFALFAHFKTCFPPPPHPTPARPPPHTVQ
jgi:hypothetical protein